MKRSTLCDIMTQRSSGFSKKRKKVATNESILFDLNCFENASRPRKARGKEAPLM